MTRTVSYGVPMYLWRGRGVSDGGCVERRGERLGLVVGRRRARNSDRRRPRSSDERQQSTGLDRIRSETVRKGFPLQLLPQCLTYMAHDSLLSFPDLNPKKMSREAAITCFKAILASQLKQEHFIEFSIAEDT